MILKIIQFFPAPMWLGFALGALATIVGWIFTWSTMTITLGFMLLVIVVWGWFRMSEYGPNVSFANHLMVLWYILLGYVPFLLVKYVFF